MKRHFFIQTVLLLIIGSTLVYSGCSNEHNSPIQPQEDVFANVASEEFDRSKIAKSGRNFRAHLSGKTQVPTPVETRAQGQVIFQLSKDGSELHYKLIVANIKDVFMAHIHLALADQNGPIVVWLYPAAPPPVPIPGRSDGVLAEGTITAADLVGPLGGMALTDLIEKIKADNTYVNVHTDAHPGGEIRGQIR